MMRKSHNKQWRLIVMGDGVPAMATVGRQQQLQHQYYHGGLNAVSY